jgi:hypothetical protein
MEFNLKARSSDTLMSVYCFEGDDDIDDLAYTECMADGYMSTLSFVKGAAKSIGVHLDTETLERWKRICNAAYLIDDFLDTAPDIETACDMYAENMELAFRTTNEQILQTSERMPDVGSKLATAIVLMKNSVSTLSENQLSLLKEAATNINAVTRLKLTCSNTDEYVALLKREAYDTSILISESASDSVRMQRRYYDFTVWCQNSITLGTLGDSAIDLRQDNLQGIINVRPSCSAVGKIALEAFHSGHAMIHTNRQRRGTIGSLLERSQFYR